MFQVDIRFWHCPNVCSVQFSLKFSENIIKNIQKVWLKIYRKYDLYFIQWCFLTGIPIVTAESDSSVVSYGQNHTIRCNIKSVPVFTIIYWQQISNGTTINITSNSPGITGITISTPSITILKATPSNSGQYMCFAVNIAGIGQSISINLNVVGGR